MPKVLYEERGELALVTLNRPAVRNAIDGETAKGLADAFRRFDRDPERKVAVLVGAGACFCAGADLKAVSEGKDSLAIRPNGDGPIGPSRMLLQKPVIAAVEGYAVAGGLELALWCDLRVAARDATFGVYCRRFGVPLVDGGTIRLPRLIGQSHAMDMILTGRAVGGEEALSMGLANRLVEPGDALEAALALANSLTAFPQTCMQGDRRSAIEQWGMPIDIALQNELRIGMEAISSGETRSGATRFKEGIGRHGDFG